MPTSGPSVLPDAFNVCVDDLEKLDISLAGSTKGKRVLHFGRGRQQEVQQIREFVHKNTLLKFALMCRKLNIDPLKCEFAIHGILMMFGKIKEKKLLVDHFCHTMNCEDMQIDWDKIHDGTGKFDLTSSSDLDSEDLGDHAKVNDMFYAMSDWMLIIDYLETSMSASQQEVLVRDKNVERMHQSLLHAGLDQSFEIDTSLVLRALLYISPGTLSGSKMLERMFLGISDDCRDLEFKCLRALSNFNDTQVDEEASMCTMLLILQCMKTRPVFFTDMQTVLQMETELTTKHVEMPTNTRVRLRELVNSIHADAPQFMETYEHWSTKQKFAATMSKHLQLLLYFVSVQVVAVPVEAFHMHFNENLLTSFMTSSNKHVQQIDAKAVIHIIKGIRVYLHNVRDLLDFRTQCLAGINKSRRLSLNLAQVLQLYIAAFQHDSIRQSCWKAVINVWNHTIETDLAQFRETHAFDVQPVIEAIVHCQME
tara:strand:- start:4123 stop:5562 length:1440 start_codon:yes stop_codon:yes gene_type:complete